MKLGTTLTLGLLGITTPLRAQSPEEPEDVHAQVVTVHAPAQRLPTASTTIVTASELRAVPKRTAEDALRLVPGLTLAQHGSEGKGHQFFLRGFDAMHGSDLEALVDGIPINEWSNIHAQGYIDAGFIIPETIRTVEVTKGPFALDQGAFAMAGSANYRLGIPAAHVGTRMAYTLGTTNRHRAVLLHAPTAGDGNTFIAAEGVHDDGFGSNRAIRRGSVSAKAELSGPSPWGTLSLLGAVYFADFELPGSMRNDDVTMGRKGFYDSYDPTSNGQSGKALVALNHRWSNELSSWESTLYVGRRRLALRENYTGFLADPVEGDRRAQLQNTWHFGANTAYHRRLHPAFVVTARIGARSEQLSQQQTHVDRAGQTLETDRALSGLQTMLNGGLGLGWAPLPTVRSEIGVRADVAQIRGRDLVDDRTFSALPLTAISPRVTLSWRAQEALRLSLAYGRGFRPPEARAFTTYVPERTGLGEDLYHGGQPAMTIADAIELGLRWQNSRYLGGSIAGFGTFIERESIYDHVSGTNLELNATRRLGSELTLHSNPTDWLYLMADVTGVDARFVNSGNPIPLAPWLVGGLRALVTKGDVLRGGFRFLAMAPRHLPHGARGAPLASVDLTVGTTWGPVDFDLELENVLNLKLREGEYHYASDWRTGAERSALPIIHYVAGPPFNARFSVGAKL